MDEEEKSTLTPEMRQMLRQMPNQEVDFVPRVAQPEHDPPIPARHPNRRAWHWQGKSRAPSTKTFPFLDEHFLEDLKAGARDEDITRWSGISLPTVIRWRRSHKIRSSKKSVQRKAVALNLFGTEHGDALHRCEDSPIRGKWEVPEYVIRKPLVYGELARCLWFLRSKLGVSSEYMAKALGIREMDVAFAMRVYDEFLSKNGHACGWCGILCSRSELYCSKECWRNAKEEIGDL